MPPRKTSASSTRSKTDIWLIGQITPVFPQTKLPSIKEVLCVFFYYKIKSEKSNKESADTTARDLLAFWEKAGIPTRLKKHVKSKILRYFMEWQQLKKNKENKLKRSEGIKQKEQEWQAKLVSLFDIAHANALKMMTIEESKSFLIAQREEGRPGKIGNIQKKYAKVAARKQEKNSRLKHFQQKEERDQLLAVPKLNRGTGQEAATAVHKTILSWNLDEKIKCMSFDTTATNTGLKNGTCILLEQKLQKDLIWLACRHHIMEIMLEAVVLLALRPSSGPDILIFKRLKKNWVNIDKNDFKPASTDVTTWQYVQNISEDMIAFAKEQLNLYQPRDDYKELLVLLLIFFGSTPDKGIFFRTPAGLHRARWMAKAIYALKIYLFRHQFHMSKREEKGMKDICIFTAKIYAKNWYQAPSGWLAPRNDLQLLKDLQKYREINKAVSEAATKKFLGHLWYLSEELVAFGFFDDGVSNDTKRKMVDALQNEGSDTPTPPKRITVKLDSIQDKNLEDFVSCNTMKFFNIIGLSTDFLEKKDVEVWFDDKDYKNSKAIVHSMRVVNDIAERGVSLMEEFNKLHTTNEGQKQYLLLAVKQHRQKFANAKKSTLLS